MSTISFTKKAAEDLVKAYSTADVIAQRAAVIKMLALLPGERVIDIGCGPGFLCESMAEVVGPQGRVHGIDISPDLIGICRDRTPSPHLTYAEEDALAMTAEDGSFDVAVCTQVAEYIPDTASLLAETFRVLRPGGRALIMATDWDCVACHSDDPERTKRIFTAWEGHCAHPRLPRSLPHHLAQAGFDAPRPVMYPLINLHFDRGTYVYGVTKLILEYVQKAGIPKEEAEAWFDELARLEAAGRFYFTSARMIFIARKPG